MVLSLRTDGQPAIQSGSGQTRDVEGGIIGSEQRRLVTEISSDDTASTRATREKKCAREIKNVCGRPATTPENLRLLLFRPFRTLLVSMYDANRTV